MKVTIVRQDNMVGVDGRFFEQDLSSLPENLHAVHWEGADGHEEWTDKANTEITTLSDYQHLYYAWVAARDLADAMAADPYHGMTPEERAAAIAVVVAAEQRRSEISEARQAAGMHGLDVAQAQEYIDNKLDTTALDATGAAITDPAVRAALVELRKLAINTKEVLSKMVPYLLD